MSRHFQRKYGVLRFNDPNGQAVVFGSGAAPGQMWAWGVWGPNLFHASGMELSLKAARRRANEELDKCFTRMQTEV